MALKRTPRGIRGQIPAGYVVGRATGQGHAQLIRIADLAPQALPPAVTTGGPGLAAFTDGLSGVVFLTSGAPSNIMSLSLVAGTYDIEGTVTFVPTGFTTFTNAIVGINTTSATLPTPPAKGGYINLNGTFSVSSALMTISTGVTRITLNSTASVYLVAQATFS